MNYEVTIGDTGKFYANSRNACEALETVITEHMLILPQGGLQEAFVVNCITGITIKFEVGQAT